MAQEDRKVGRFEDGTDAVIGALIEVHRHLGPGLLESAYEACVCAELCERGLKFERQRPLAVDYKGVQLDCGYRLDLVVEESILLELKAVERLLPIHQAQVITGSRPITPSPSALPSFLCDLNDRWLTRNPGQPLVYHF